MQHIMLCLVMRVSWWTRQKSVTSGELTRTMRFKQAFALKSTPQSVFRTLEFVSALIISSFKYRSVYSQNLPKRRTTMVLDFMIFLDEDGSESWKSGLGMREAFLKVLPMRLYSSVRTKSGMIKKATVDMIIKFCHIGLGALKGRPHHADSSRCLSLT